MGNSGPPSGLIVARRFLYVQPRRLRRGCFVGRERVWDSGERIWEA